MRLNDVYRQARQSSRLDLCRFMLDMRRAGVRLRYYRGRYFWRGPAAFVDNLQQALRATSVRCQWDHMGLGFVVYPVQSL
jgi:hypothetical protein